MVSQVTIGSESATRGPIIEETVVAARNVPDLPLPMPSFWGSVVAGSVVVLGIGALSELLMVGCHVGVMENGAPAVGLGTAFWMAITACIAYYVGGLVASRLSLNGSWLQGLVLWGFSIPLSLLIGAAITGAAGVAYAHTTHLTEQLANSTNAGSLYGGNLFFNFAGIWTAFVTVALGLIFAVIGSMSGSCMGAGQNVRRS